MNRIDRAEGAPWPPDQARTDGAAELETTLRQVIAAAVDAELGDHVSVSERVPGGEMKTTASSGELVALIDKSQHRLWEGPCIDGVYFRDVLTSSAVATDPRWPRWGPEIAEWGITSLISVHLFADQDAMAALNVYSDRPRDYSEDDREAARLIAAHASIAFAHVRGPTHWWKAIDARHSIGQAEGILMNELGVRAIEAFGVLRRLSRERNVRLHVLAAEVVRNGGLPPPVRSVPASRPAS
ncbi:GAF domain-containing protein [Nakamurella panacisegetis]|uniref:GAF domain-containing protein n=1 Tax=Nakamurella panacisegetis TaxID=1090615 RepID=A0A1H0SAZ1_9ACTN|nr:GAF and ANTAR domain-containing protein [Nakamurella panacisegetis]SDP38336.1 GAF domain-containing protein [Nakamurella panacisegetis]